MDYTNPYSLSQDYAALWSLVCEGKIVVGWASLEGSRQLYELRKPDDPAYSEADLLAECRRVGLRYISPA